MMRLRRPASVWRRKKKETTTVDSQPEIRIEPESVMVKSPQSPPLKTHYKMNDVIRLNVGGQRFDTRLRTLLSDRSNELFTHFVVLLEPDLTESKLPSRDAEGNFFLDRDPEHFRTLLNNLRFYVLLQAKQRLADGTNGGIEDDEDVRSTKSVGFLGRLLKN